MIRAAAVLAFLSFPVATLHAAQDEEALARGQKYLDKVAAVWTAKLPQERLCGMYFGRQWMGWMTLAVKAAPADSGAAYEVIRTGELSMFGKTFTMNGRALLAKNLSPLSSEIEEATPSGMTKRTLTVEGGRWKVREDEKGEIRERDGKIVPGITFEGNLLPLFAMPDEECRILSLESRKGLNDFKRLPAKSERLIDGKKESCTVLEIGHGGAEPERWYFSGDGRPLELQSDGPTRLRPITPAQRGKNLDEPLRIEPPTRRVLDLFLAIQKNDADAAAACFDFDRFARESVPDFNERSAEGKKEASETMKSTMMKNLMSAAARGPLPEAALLEETLSNAMKTTLKDGEARVQIIGGVTWKLYQAKEGPRKGQWLIFGVGQE
jgi:hypothetical protein